MCVSAVVFRRGREPIHCDGFGDLRAALGWRPAACAGIVPRNRDCLCVVDMERTACLAGMRLDPPTYETGSGHYDAWALREAADG
jgi:hypothetical protein